MRYHALSCHFWLCSWILSHPQLGKQKCRHGESEEDVVGVRDHDRSISRGGYEASARVAEHLRDIAWLPDLLLCSNSRRTRQTVEAMAEAVPAFGDADAHFLGTLYTVAALDGMTRSHLTQRARPSTPRSLHRLNVITEQHA